MLAVWKLECDICTSCPGRRARRGIGKPFLFRIIVEFVMKNTICLFILFCETVINRLLFASIQRIRAVVTLGGATGGRDGRLTVIENALLCGGMLLVIRGEKVTSTRIPLRRSRRHIGSRKEFRITVLLFTLSCSWSVVVIPLCHGTE